MIGDARGSNGLRNISGTYFDLGPYEGLKRCRVRRDEESLDFLKNIKGCRVVRTYDNYIEIELD